MLIDQDNFSDLLSMRREIKRLTNVIVVSLAKRKELKEKMEQVWDEIEQEQQRLPFDEVKATERTPSNGNGRRRRSGQGAGAPA